MKLVSEWLILQQLLQYSLRIKAMALANLVKNTKVVNFAKPLQSHPPPILGFD